MSFIATLDSKSVDVVENNLRVAINKVLSNRGMLSQIADDVIQDVKFQSRRGYSIPNNARFKDLKSSWIETRKQIGKVGGVGDAFSPRRSNITVSGQLLDSMDKTIPGKGQFRIIFKGSHEPYLAEYKNSFFRRVNGKRKRINPERQGIRVIGEKLSNEKLAGYIAEGGRPFVGVRTFMHIRINKIIVDHIRRSGRALGFTK